MKSHEVVGARLILMDCLSTRTSFRFKSDNASLVSQSTLMRPFQLRPTNQSETDTLHELWTSLINALSPAELSYNGQLEEQGRFVISLIRQYQNQGLSQEALLKVAHGALVNLLQRAGPRPDALPQYIGVFLHNALIAAIQEAATKAS